ncbi:MAG: hypothetical protein K0S47_1521 [Herbinix sp.]|jgi:cell division protein FtsQ|nr:hypothetical protein [Herbinix sp.]
MLNDRQRKRESVLRRLLRKTLIFLILIGVPVIFFAGTFRLKDITVQGSERYTKEQIKDIFVQSLLDNNTILLYLKYSYFKSATIPFVEKMDLELVDSNTINVRIYEKMVIGCVEFMGEYLYFDKDGIVVESSSEQLEDIPKIIGLKFDQIVLSEKLEVQSEDLYHTILNLTQLIDWYDLDVDAIRFSSNNEVTIECGDIKVLLGKKDTYDNELSILKSILEEAKGMDIKIDMTNGTDTFIATPNKAD